MKKYLAATIVFGFLFIGFGIAHAVNYSFTYLDIPGKAVDMNESGTIIGEYKDADDYWIYFIFSGSSWVTSHHPDDVRGNLTHLSSINNAGTIVGRFFAGDGFERGFSLKDGIYTSMQYDDFQFTYAFDINDSGIVIGESERSMDMPIDITGFIYDGNTYTKLSYEGRESFIPRFINNNGAIVGEFFFSPSTWYMVTGSTWEIISYPNLYDIVALNNRNHIIGRYDLQLDGSLSSFTYDGITYRTINYPGASTTEALGLNDKDMIVGSYIDSGGKRHGFSYINGVWSSIDYPGATDTYARLVNNNGLIVGSFTKDGQEGQFLATPLSAVAIDIRPWNSSNLINRKGWGLLPVVILSNSEFDAVDIMDLDTITFGRIGDEHSMAFCSPIEWNVNRDSYKDLVCFFWIQRTGFQCGDTQGILKGTTQSGIHVEAKDSVRVIPCK